jgi:hypothetical protein
MVIRRKGRELAPATKEDKAKFRALFSDDDWITFKAYFNDARWGRSKKARTALSNLAAQYTTYLDAIGETELFAEYVVYLADVIEEWKSPEHHAAQPAHVKDDKGPSVWAWSQVRHRWPRGTADTVRRVWVALTAVRECLGLLDAAGKRPPAGGEAIGPAERPTNVSEAIGSMVLAFLPLIAESDQIFKRLNQQHNARRRAGKRWAKTASLRQEWQRRAAEMVKAHPHESDRALARRLMVPPTWSGSPAERTLLRYIKDARS